MNLLNKKSKLFKIFVFVLCSLVIIVSLNYVLQRYVAHTSQFLPNYKRVTLTENSDYETIFLQTGLGVSAVDKLLKADRFDEILKTQDFFFEKHNTECRSLLGWVTKEDRLTDDFITLYDLQPGDILVSLSTHSFGWRHGHAAIVIDDFQTVESVMFGIDSSVENIDYWTKYTNFALLRVKDKNNTMRNAVADFSKEKLINKPYSILAGFGLEKAPKFDKNGFSLHCSYLTWYAWQSFGVDLDSDGGRLVSSYDILHSDKLEVVQLFGLNPNEFI